MSTGLAGREPGLLGHDACDRAMALQNILKAAGIRRPLSFIECKHCKGSGVDPAVRPRYNRWREKKPPKGHGFQLWEDCSEGSPVSPVFATLDELCAWCEGHATTFADNRTTKEDWKRMLEQDFVHAAYERRDGTKLVMM